LAREIRTQLSDRFDVVLVPLDFEGDWTAEGVERQLDAAYSDPEISVVFGFGHMAVRAVGGKAYLGEATSVANETSATSARSSTSRTKPTG
jgi:hypothetical protein